MANLLYSSKRPNVVKYNNADVHHVVYGGKTIWNKRITVKLTKDCPWVVPADGMKVISINGIEYLGENEDGKKNWYDTGLDKYTNTLRKGLHLIYRNEGDDWDPSIDIQAPDQSYRFFFFDWGNRYKLTSNTCTIVLEY